MGRSILDRIDSVQTFPQFPRIEAIDDCVTVVFARTVIAKSSDVVRVVETGRAPNYYIPLKDVDTKYLVPCYQATISEHIGVAQYHSLKYYDQFIPNAAWCYPNPSSSYADLKNRFSFFAHLLTECFIGTERVDPVKSKQYGGWSTGNLVGPFEHDEVH